MSFPYVSDILNAVFGTEWHLPIPMFGILVVAAIVAPTCVTRREVGRYEANGTLPPLTHVLVADLALVSAVAGLIGARLFHVLDHADQFVTDPASMIFTRGGFSIFGGLCFGTVAAVLFLRRHSIPIRPMLDAAAPSMMLGYGIGRLGCQIVGDGDWGVVADSTLKPVWFPDWLWAQTYENNILGVVIPAPGVYPTPLYESMMAFAIFGVLWALRSHRHAAGYLFSMYLLLTGFERLLIEKIRINIEYHAFGVAFTQAEAIAFLLVITGFIGVLTTLRERKFWTKTAFSVGVLTALSACVPF
jgi:phosphatidylglycerol:prolipoprotein diacylglycerol transferase